MPLIGGAQLAVDTHRQHAPRKRRATSHHRGRSGPARSATAEGTDWLGALVAPGLWCSRLRSVAGGPKKRSSLVHAKARSEPSLLRKRVEQGWRLKWGSLFSCTATRAVAASLLELPGARAPTVRVLLPMRLCWSGSLVDGLRNFDVT